MIDRTHPLPITRQAQIVNISRGSVYYKSEPTSDADLKLMRRIDELHLELPFAGARMLRDLLRAEGFPVGRKHMTTLMRRMGITALYRKPNTSKKAPGTHDLAVPASHAVDHALEPCLGDGHQLHPYGAWLRLPRRRDRLAQSAGAGLAAVDLDGHGVLHRGARRSDRQVRQAGDLQYGPG
jgi:hypothetical protein